MSGALRLFVYGTLRAGEPAHALLRGAALLRRCRTAPGWTKVELDAYPALVPGEGTVEGELYEVDAATLAALDEYEGHPDLFVRVTVVLDDGTSAQAYRKTEG